MTEVPKHIEVMARGMYDASPMRQSIGDGPWTVVKWEDAGSGLQEHLIAGVTAAHAALVEAGFVVLPVGLSSDQIKEANATAERGMIEAAEKP